MSRFVVCFMKNVLGDNGRQREVCQSSIEIDAADEGWPPRQPSENSANCSLCATGHCMPTGSRSRRPIFHPESHLIDKHKV